MTHSLRLLPVSRLHGRGALALTSMQSAGVAAHESLIAAVQRQNATQRSLSKVMDAVCADVQTSRNHALADCATIGCLFWETPKEERFQ